MQTLWARVAQVRSTCKCSLCSSPANALTKRVTGVPIWSRISQADFFLVFSSTLAFEAAVFDSVRKDARSKQWDQVIAEGREKIEATEADQKRRVEALLNSLEQRVIEDESQQNNAVKDGLDWSWQGVFAWATRIDASRSAAGFEGWKGPSLKFLKKLTTAELQKLQSDKRILRYFYGGPDCANLEPVPYTSGISTQKLRTLEWSMAKLVLKIMWAFGVRDSEKSLASVPAHFQKRAVPLEEMETRTQWPDLVVEANAKLGLLSSHSADSDIYENFERPPMPRFDEQVTAYDDGRILLNTALHATLQEMEDKEKLSSHLAKICQHLLLSRTPPNIHAYNLLLVRFCQLEEISLVHFVLEAMWESHIRPNEITHATVLRFFTVTGNKAEFSMYVKRMRGLKGGLALANPNKPLSPLVRSQVHLFGENLHKVAEKARLNHEVYSALIVGLLRFFDPEDAMYWYRAMIDQGWRPTAEILTAILRECCLRSDWGAGVAVWQQFAREAVNKTLLAYEWMLRLCQYCNQRQVYRNIIDDGVQEGILPIGILDQAFESGSRDVSLVLANVKTKPVTEIDRKMVNFPLRKRIKQLQKFEVAEGRPYLVGNSLYGAAKSKAELEANIHTRARDARLLFFLRIAVAKHEEAFSKLSADIALTIGEVGSQLPTIPIREPILKMGLSGSLRNMPLEPSPNTVLAFYDEFRKRSVSQLEHVSAIANLSHVDEGLAALSL